MANFVDYVFQIFLITLGLTIFGIILNRIMGAKQGKMTGIQEKALILQERMRTAQAIGDYQLLREIQAESLQLTKQMMVKQVLPLCIRCVIFLVIFAVLGFVYADFPEWYFFYILFSLLFSFGFFGINYAYRRFTGKVDKRDNLLKQISGMSYTGEEDSFQLTHTGDINTLETQPPNQDLTSWKEKIQPSNLDYDKNEDLPEKKNKDWREKLEK